MSVAYSAAEAAGWAAGTLLQGSAQARFGGTSIDTRTIAPGELFIAIAGPNHDGHVLLPQAMARGAGGLLIERGRALPEDLGSEVPVIAVEDSVAALGEIAAGHRAEFAGPVVAITGSNGKTTTKEMCAAILCVQAPCHRNEGNLNNRFGLPLTLLRRSAADRSMVVELGMNHRGEIAPLAAIARPDIGVITNVGSAHIEHLGSREEIALEKGDLVASLPEGGTAVLNADDPRVADQARRTRARVMTFGRGPAAAVRAEQVRARGGTGVAFQLAAPAGRAAVEVSGLGDTTVSNALAAAAGAMAAGAPLTTVSQGLAAYRPVRGRLERRDRGDGVVLIDDTYNANPQSLEVALRLLAREPGEGRGLAVLGDMGELGERAEAAHRDAGRLVADLGIDFLFVLGEHADDVATAALQAGMERDQVRVGRSHDELAARVEEVARKGDWILVKGSRSMKMERIVECLAGETR